MAISQSVFEIVTVFLFGLILGSFSTALSWRVARGQSWVSDRSACPSCHTVLRPLDLVPLFSWLALRGRCRHCGAAISARYPLTELSVIAGCLGIYAVWHFTAPAFVLMAALPFLTALFVIDLEQMILPDSLLIILAGLGIIFIAAASWPALNNVPELFAFRVAATVLYAGIAWIMGKLVSLRKKRDALGFGDVKFFGMAGLWLGISGLPFFMIAGGVVGVAWGIGWRIGRGPGAFPFGPALILAFYGCLLLLKDGFLARFGF